MKISRREFLAAGGALLATAALRPLIRIERAIGAAPIPRYNIITIMTDDQDYASMPVMRHLRNYPRGSWIEFDNFICNDGICGPSRASFYTGLYSRNSGVIGNKSTKPFNKEVHTLPVWLKEAGYTTAMFGKYLFGSTKIKPTPPGWDIFKQGGRAPSLGPQARSFLRSVTEPFFMMLTPIDPHMKARPDFKYRNEPVWLPDPSPSYDDPATDKSTWVQKARKRPAKIKALRKERERAHQALLGVDDLVMLVIEELEQLQMLDNTVICFTSDNGFLWGEHGLTHKHWHYEEVARLPLLIRYPGLAGENRRESRVVGNVDLAATFAAIAGATPSRPLDGRSLLPLIHEPVTYWDEAVLLDHFPESKNDFAFTGVRVAGWSYVRFHNLEEEMYDLTADPYQLRNLAHLPEYGGMKRLLIEKMDALINRDARPTATPTPTQTPTETATPTQTPTPTETATPTQTPTPTETATPTQTPTPTETATPTQTPTPTETATPTQTPTPTETATPTQTPTPTDTP